MSDRLHYRGSFLLCLLVLLVAQTSTRRSCLAQLAESKRSDWIALAQQAKADLGSRPYPSPQQAGDRVRTAAIGLAEHLNRRASPDRAAAWLRYVDADPLVDAIVSQRPQTEITALASRLHTRLVGNIAGLEMTPMMELRDAADSLVAAARYTDPERSQRWVQQQLDGLIRLLRVDASVASPTDAAGLSLIVQRLDHSNQAPKLVDAIYNTYSRPNLLATIDGQLIQQVVARPVDRLRPVNDCILGTRVIGNGHLQGAVVGKLVPSIGKIQIDLALTGQLRSNTVGYNGPVRLPSVSQGTIHATRSIWLGEDGVSLSSVASTASLSSTITSIDHPLRLVRRIAAKQIAEKKPQSDSIARERFRSQVVTDFTNQTNEAVQRIAARSPGGGATANRVLSVADAQQTFQRLSLTPPTRTIGSTSNSVFLHATQRSGRQLSALTAPPSFANLTHSSSSASTGSASRRGLPAGDVTLQLHESLIDNLASTVLGGRNITGRQIDRLIGNVKQTSISRATPGSAIESPPEDFEIEFASLRPIIFDARDQQLRIGIRGNRFRQEGSDLRSALEITATYEPIELDGAQVLRRVGPVQVDFAGADRLRVAQVAQRRSIQKLFNDRFPEILFDQPIVLPMLAAVPSLSGRVFRVGGIDAQDGWLSLSFR